MSENTLSVLNDKVRRDILVYLKEGSKSAGDIADQFNLTRATISYHLTKLKKADLIIESKYKNYIYYEINTSVLDDLVLWFMQFQGGGKE